MTIRDYLVTPFKAVDVALLLEHGQASGGLYRNDDALLAAVEKQPNVWTFWYGTDVLLCGGTLEMWPGRHLAWSYVSAAAGPHMLFVTREARKALARPKGRVEFAVRADFADGHRWARMLGFERETPRLRQYGPDGEDHVGYVRVN